MTWYSLTCTIIMVISCTLVKNGVSFSRLSSSKLLSYSIISLGFPSLFLFWQFLSSLSEEILFPISSTSFPWESISVTIKSWYLGKLVKVNIRLIIIKCLQFKSYEALLQTWKFKTYLSLEAYEERGSGKFTLPIRSGNTNNFAKTRLHLLYSIWSI